MQKTSYWERFRRQRISRRRMLAATGVGAAGLVIAAACDDNGGGGGNGGTPSPDGEPTRGGKYIYPITGDWGTVDPVTSVSFAPGIFPRLYNVLLERGRVDPDFLYYDLAESHEQPDGETYIYTIRSGVKIAPNDLNIEQRDLDSSDAKAWLDRISADETAVHRPFTNERLDSYEANGNTFTIKTKGPYAYFLLRLGAPLGGTIPPKEFFEQDISLKEQGVGAGPFKIRPGTYQETGGMVVERNTNYYRTDDATGEQLPYVDEIEAVRISDRQPRRVAFQNKQIHEYAVETIDERDELVSTIADVQVFESPSNTFIAFTMNPTKPPWDDDRIRKAAMFALNRQEYVDRIVGAENGKIDGLVHWQLGPFALSEDELNNDLQPYDPEQSKALIREVTGEDTITINVMYPVSDIEFHDQHLPIWRQQMEAAGFRLDEEALDFTTWLTRYTQVQYDSSLSLNQVYETAEVPLDFHASRGPQGNDLYAIGIGAVDQEIEDAIAASKQAPDPDEHVKRVLDAQRLIYEKGPAFLPIMSWQAYTLRHGIVKNYPQGLGASGLYLNNWWLQA